MNAGYIIIFIYFEQVDLNSPSLSLYTINGNGFRKIVNFSCHGYLDTHCPVQEVQPYKRLKYLLSGSLQKKVCQFLLYVTKLLEISLIL